MSRGFGDTFSDEELSHRLDRAEVACGFGFDAPGNVAGYAFLADAHDSVVIDR